jgi:hypothetical protein
MAYITAEAVIYYLQSRWYIAHVPPPAARAENRTPRRRMRRMAYITAEAVIYYLQSDGISRICRLRRHALKPDAAAQDAPHGIYHSRGCDIPSAKQMVYRACAASGGTR